MSRRIVLTGGPGAGKTVVSQALAAAHPTRFVRVPEAATQIYQMLQTRWDRLDDEARRDVQRKIFRLQVDQEEDLARAFPAKTLLVDRGTIDGSGYWPDGPQAYWIALGSTPQEQLTRYDMVIWLATCTDIPGAYDAELSNPCRYESGGDAVRRGEQMRELWRNHPRFVEVAAFPDVKDKVAAVSRLLQET